MAPLVEIEPVTEPATVPRFVLPVTVPPTVPFVPTLLGEPAEGVELEPPHPDSTITMHTTPARRVTPPELTAAAPSS